MITAHAPTQVERALIARLPKQHEIRCNLNNAPILCRATNAKGLVSFYSAVRVDGKWRFKLIGQVL